MIKKINENIMIKNNDKIDIYIKDNLLFDLPKNINYIYNDENIIIAFKPQIFYLMMRKKIHIIIILKIMNLLLKI